MMADPIKVTCKYSSGTYKTNKVQGQSASATQDAKCAVEALGRKLLPDQQFAVTQVDNENWIITTSQVVTIAITAPVGIKLCSTINVQGHEVSCQTINWGTNSCMQASALEQRLEAALGVLDDAGGNYLDDYIDRLNELSDEGDLEELVNTTIDLHGTF